MDLFGVFIASLVGSSLGGYLIAMYVPRETFKNLMSPKKGRISRTSDEAYEEEYLKRG